MRRAVHLALVALLLAGCPGNGTDGTHEDAGAAHTKFGIGIDPSGGFIPGSGGGASAAVLAGTGLTASGVTLAVNPTYAQRRIPTTCGAGTFMTSVAQDGTATCTTEPGDISSVVPGTGLTGGATSGDATLTADSTYLQRRISTDCGAGNSIRSVAVDGTPTCVSAGAGTVTQIIAGTGLSGGTITTSGTIAVNLTPTTCAAGQAETATAAAGTATCSTFVDTAGTSLSLSGHTLNVALPTTTCSAGQAEVSTAAAGSSTCATFVDTAGTSLSLSGHTLNVALPVTACGAGQYATSTAADGTVTCSVPRWNDYTSKVIQFEEEWLQSSIPSRYTVATSGGTNGSIAGPSDGTRMGIMQITTGTAATGRYGLFLDSANTYFLGGGTATAQFDLTTETLNDDTDKYVIEAGWLDTVNAKDNVDGCYFLYDRSALAAAPTTGSNTSGVNKWACLCASNSVRTEYLMDGVVVSDSSFTTVSAPIVANTYDRLEVQVNAAATEADFFVGGVKSCVITTHIPSGASRATSFGVSIQKGAGTTTNEKLDIDRQYMRIDLTTARTP